MMNVGARWVGALPDQQNQVSGEDHTVPKKIDVESTGNFLTTRVTTSLITS